MNYTCRPLGFFLFLAHCCTPSHTAGSDSFHYFMQAAENGTDLSQDTMSVLMSRGVTAE